MSLPTLLKYALFLFLAFFILTGFLPFFFRKPLTPPPQFLPTVTLPLHNEGLDRVILLEDPLEAGRMRLQLVRQATQSIDVVYHTFSPGAWNDMFFTELFSAADRGVKVRIMADGIIGGFGAAMDEYRSAITIHPMMSLALFEPLNLLNPYSWQNRLHDKILIVDGEKAIMGGRNSADKTFLFETLTDHTRPEPVYDREVLVWKTDPSRAESGVDQLSAYCDSLWNYPHIRIVASPTKEKETKRGHEARESILERGRREEKAHGEFYTGWVSDWYSATLPVDSISLVSNPLDRGSKVPTVWYAIRELALEAESEVFIQSPYIVLYPAQRRVMREVSGKAELTFLTNSLVSTPNIFGFSGYLRSRNSLLKLAPVYEYMGEGSIHAKSLIIDSDMSLIGSFNLDPRSLNLDTETMLVIKGEEFNSLMRQTVATWMDASSRVTETGIEAPADPSIPLERPGLLRALIFTLFSIVSVVIHPFV